jgi:hypothetical protein
VFTLPDLRSSTVRVVGLGSLVALLLVACVLAPNAVGATEEGSVPPACGLDVLVVLDDDASLDDSTAPELVRALV